MNKQVAAIAKAAIETELKGRGISPDFTSLIMLQLAVETAGFKSNLVAYNNLGGEIWVGQKNAYNTGIAKPKGEAKGTYAGFKTIQDWAKSYINILQKRKVFEAKSVDEFAAILKKGGYYEASETDYKKALKSWIPQIKRMFTDLNFSTKTIGVIAIFGGIFLTFLIISYGKQ